MIHSAHSNQPKALLGWMESLADATRLRLLRVLERNELGVAELCDVLQLPQSTVSRHLKILADQKWVRGRRQGTNHLYRTILDELDAGARRLWLLAREQTENWPASKQDRLRLDRLLREKQGEAETFFAGAAGEWDRLRSDLYGRHFSDTATLALLPPAATIADLGCGTGQVIDRLAPFVARVIGVDISPAMLKAATRRLSQHKNVDLRRGDIAAIPIDDASVDAALLVLSLTYVPDPAAALREMHRILKPAAAGPAGRAVIVDLLPHDREDFRRQMGQTRLGFDAKEIEQMLLTAGFKSPQVRPLPPEPNAKGPALFLATATRKDPLIQDELPTAPDAAPHVTSAANAASAPASRSLDARLSRLSSRAGTTFACYDLRGMDTTRRFFARQILELQLQRAKGYAFEDLFKSVMQRRYPDFTPIQPYGNLGDRKNDGYIPSSGTFFQVYAPKTPEEKLAQAASKAEGDFEGLRNYWQSKCPIKDYRFVFNDRYGGSVVPIETALLAIAKKFKIQARPFLCKDLEAEALQLSLEVLQDVLGTIIPDAGLLKDADYYAVRDVVEYVLNIAAPAVPDGKLLAPEFDAKIKFNGLSERVGRLLGAAALQTDVVDDFFSNRSGTHRQDLRDHLAVVYATERKGFANAKESADLIFFAVLSAITPKSSSLQASVQNAALVVMAYYFEACDVFEGPDASA